MPGWTTLAALGAQPQLKTPCFNDDFAIARALNVRLESFGIRLEEIRAERCKSTPALLQTTGNDRRTIRVHAVAGASTDWAGRHPMFAIAQTVAAWQPLHRRHAERICERSSSQRSFCELCQRYFGGQQHPGRRAS